MKKIPLTLGKVALVDDEDYEYVSKVKWYAHFVHGTTFYAKRAAGKPQKTLAMHRVIMNPPSKFVIDHIDHDGLNNQRSNLRIVTTRGNAMNRLPTAANRNLGGTQKKYNRWISRINIRGKRRWLGSYTTKEEAIATYNAFAKIAEYSESNIVRDCCRN